MSRGRSSERPSSDSRRCASRGAYQLLPRACEGTQRARHSDRVRREGGRDGVAQRVAVTSGRKNKTSANKDVTGMKAALHDLLRFRIRGQLGISRHPLALEQYQRRARLIVRVNLENGKSGSQLVCRFRLAWNLFANQTVLEGSKGKTQGSALRRA
eukprot:6184866-Pleurochrysis_carterae.AAC.4